MGRRRLEPWHRTLILASAVVILVWLAILGLLVWAAVT
jgi:hypothetical protein